MPSSLRSMFLGSRFGGMEPESGILCQVQPITIQKIRKENLYILAFCLPSSLIYSTKISKNYDSLLPNLFHFCPSPPVVGYDRNRVSNPAAFTNSQAFLLRPVSP